MKYISMFSGIEAATAAWHPLGWKPIAFSEIEPFPSAVLAHHYPEVPNVGDMSAHDWSQYKGLADLVVGGPPCQAFSVAGLRRSLQDDRGNLSLQFVKAIDAIDPEWAVVENVPGWLSTSDNAFGCMLAGLVGDTEPLVSFLPDGKWPNAGLVVGPRRAAAWRVLDAQYFHLAQRRRRVFIIVQRAGNGDGPAAVLFEPESGGGNPAPSREEGQGVARKSEAGASVSSGRGWWNESQVAATIRSQESANKADTLIHCPDVSPAMKARDCKGPSSDGDGLPLSAHSLRGEGFDASEDGTGRGTPIIPIDMRQASRGEKMTNNRPGGSSGGPSGTGIGSPGDPAFSTSGNCGVMEQGDRTAALNCATDPNQTIIRRGMAVRRITPLEAERLQGFPDFYTLIQYRGKLAADGPRYRALGNSMAETVMAWIGRRIESVHDPLNRR